ncbi:glycosyltransferase [Methylophilales bacterium MBRSG12]|uniref:Glycosyltransferase n=1 Tax=Methylophilales bacterium MBRS-H7 TaxID=1623450 RepID=A0A0H4IZS8_9PROT|nr:glycosyltransferase [Methylophilales bacterium MBRSF5]AKO66481.1 glycosyltransferase [Methylophilales bacterium MBRS-H7]AKO67795.1 glycosyltransferase [Methylophilales bacterium MBRSG12]
MINVYVGYDEREAIAYHVFCHSVIKNTSIPVKITPLVLSQLKEFNETHQDRSNDFVYSRFLTPYLNEFNGWAIFADGDMICQADLKELIGMADPNKALMVVKHDYQTKASIKYLGNINENYPRKNWSSVILWNCSHPKHKILTPEFVSNQTGKFLHRFSWLDDNDIGELPVEWNWLACEYEKNADAKLIHYTLGTPCFKDFRDTDMAEIWYDYYESAKKGFDQ